MTDWRKVDCARCNGHGVVAVYSSNDFEGPAFCPKCGGSCEIWLSPRGGLAEYPGGKFLGSRADYAQENVSD